MSSVKGTILVIVALALVGAYSAAIPVDETEHIIITQFGQYKRTISDPGLAFKIPFAQKETSFEKRILASDAPPEEYLTLDKKRLVADPKGVLAEEGIEIEQGYEIKVVEDTEKVSHLVLPPAPPPGELSESELDGVAGGATFMRVPFMRMFRTTTMEPPH